MALRTNQPVAIAIDGAGTASTEVRKIFGKEARLSDFVPRIAARTKTPSYFPRITKSGTKAAFSLITLPAIEDGEDEAQFVARWLDFYAQQVEEFLLEHPEAMRGTGGIWTRLLDA
jgi:lauroyl/myristoyl acyltransferase